VVVAAAVVVPCTVGWGLLCFVGDVFRGCDAHVSPVCRAQHLGARLPGLRIVCLHYQRCMIVVFAGSRSLVAGVAVLVGRRFRWGPCGRATGGAALPGLNPPNHGCACRTRGLE
jgi:hypothetical protein